MYVSFYFSNKKIKIMFMISILSLLDFASLLFSVSGLLGPPFLLPWWLPLLWSLIVFMPSGFLATILIHQTHLQILEKKEFRISCQESPSFICKFTAPCLSASWAYLGEFGGAILSYPSHMIRIHLSFTEKIENCSRHFSQNRNKQVAACTQTGVLGWIWKCSMWHYI